MTAQLQRTEDAAIRGRGNIDLLGKIGLALAVVAAICGLLGGRQADAALVDGYGLLRALPTLYWVGVVVGVVATFVLLWVAVANEGTHATATVPALWLLLLHTAPQLAHAHPRFPMAWTHLGLLRSIDDTGTADVLIDTRLAWPGVHGALLAPLARLDGWALEGLLRIWPSLVTGAAAILVAALARRSYPTVPIIGSLSALVYVLLAWTGQDSFSPRSLGFLWFVAVLVLVESGPLQTGSAWSSAVPVLPRLSTSGGDRPASRSTPAFVALVILCFGAVVSHPLAPLVVCLALMLLGLYGRSVAWRLLVFVGVAYVVWFLVSTQPWWGDGPGSLSRPLDGVLDGSAAEMAGSANATSPEFQTVTRSRLYLTLGTYASVLLVGLAMAGERLRHLRPAVPLVPLVAVPAVVFAIVGSGGPSIVQVLAFTLAPASILVGRILASVRVRTLPVMATVVAAALCPLLLLTRFGGERFEFTTEPDRAAVLVAYERADDDTLFVADNGFVPWGDQGVGRNAFTVQPVEPSEAWVDAVREEAALAGKRRIIVILTDGQLGWNVHGLGLPPEALDDFAEWLLERSGSELLFHEESSWAIEL